MNTLCVRADIIGSATDLSSHPLITKLSLSESGASHGSEDVLPEIVGRAFQFPSLESVRIYVDYEAPLLACASLARAGATLRELALSRLDVDRALVDVLKHLQALVYLRLKDANLRDDFFDHMSAPDDQGDMPCPQLAMLDIVHMSSLSKYDLADLPEFIAARNEALHAGGSTGRLRKIRIVKDNPSGNYSARLKIEEIRATNVPENELLDNLAGSAFVRGDVWSDRTTGSNETELAGCTDDP